MSEKKIIKIKEEYLIILYTVKRVNNGHLRDQRIFCYSGCFRYWQVFILFPEKSTKKIAKNSPKKLLEKMLKKLVCFSGIPLIEDKFV